MTEQKGIKQAWKNIINGLLFGITFVWQIPQSLTGLVMLLYFKLFGGAELISCRKLCLCYKAKNMRGGISLGNFAFVSPSLSKDEASIAHEQLGHTWDSKLMGPLYLIIVGLPSIIHAWLYDYKKSCYYDFFTEKLANKHAGLGVDKNCRLYKKEGKNN